MIGRPWVMDGIDEPELAAIKHTGDIAAADARLAEEVANLPWAAFDIKQPEADAVSSLSGIASSDAELAGRIINLPGIADEVTRAEADAMRLFGQIFRQDMPLAGRVTALTWVADGITPAEVEVLEYLHSLADTDVPLAMRFARLPWLDGGVAQDEFSGLQTVADIGGKDAGLAERIATRRWFSNGIAGREISYIENLAMILDGDAALAGRIANLPWLSDDDVTESELSVVENIGYIAAEDATAAGEIIAMPFLATVEPADVNAAESLARLAISNETTFRKVMTRFNVRNGISDSWANVVAMLHGVSRTNPELVDTLLDQNRVTQEFRTIHLPLSKDVRLTIVRTAPGTKQSMDVLEHSVRNIEEFMGEPLPNNYVGLLFGEAVAEGSAGTYFRTHISALPEFGVNDGSREAEYAGHLIAHEVAHYYWNYSNSEKIWIAEGAAEFLASISENRRAGKFLAPTRSLCANINTIAELERRNPGSDSDDFRCHYVLGERFFLDLYDTLGERAFRPGFRNLYLMSQVDDDADDYPGTKVGITHIQEAFRSDQAAVQTVIDRWYHGTAPR